MKRYFYLLCVLRQLKAFDDSPPVSKQEFLSLVEESLGPTDMVGALLLSDDLLQREAVIAGEIRSDQTDLTVLSNRQAKLEEPLPDYLASEQENDDASRDKLIANDPVWRNYFYHVLKIAKNKNSHFLKAWVQFEVGLRNALARVRARRLKLDPLLYLVAPELEDPDIIFENILADWSETSSPLEGVKVLDRARWNWLTEHEQWYSFGGDEIAAYTAKLMILHRWRSIRGIDHKETGSK
jgi:hypothetical protein